jgi:hypothetical protein
MAGLAAGASAFALGGGGPPVEHVARGNTVRFGGGIGSGQLRSGSPEPLVLLPEALDLLAGLSKLHLGLFEPLELANELSAFLLVQRDGQLVFRSEEEAEVPRPHDALRHRGNGHPDLQFGYARKCRFPKLSAHFFPKFWVQS